MLAQLAVMNWNALITPPTVFVLAGIVVALVAIVVPQWCRVQQTTTLARLTRDMMDRGFSADEIERVLESGARIDARSDGDGKN